MFEELRLRAFPLRIKQRVILAALIGLVTFSFGLAVAFLQYDHTAILNEAMNIQDSLTYQVIKNGRP